MQPLVLTKCGPSLDLYLEYFLGDLFLLSCHHFLQIQEKEIGEKRTVVLGDLAKVEPAVKDAQQGP